MSTVTVLRLEDANGGGAFRVANMQDYTDAAVHAGLMTPEEDAYIHWHCSEKGFPAPSGDLSLEEDADAKGINVWGGRFGFSSPEQAREWFPPCMEAALRANGQTLTVWDVPADEVAIGDRQVVFNHRVATLRERLDVSALWNREVH